MTATMKANRIHMFGGPEVILFEDVPRPTPGTGDYAVPFARAAGAHVIASVLPRDRDEALRPGADEVISIPSEEAQGLRGRSCRARGQDHWILRSGWNGGAARHAR